MAQTCTLDDCDRPRHGDGYCKLHYNRNKRNGDPNRLLGPGCAGWGPANHAWKGDNADGPAIRRRLRMLWGPASIYPCAGNCGRQARHWAYDHKDPNAKPDRYGHLYSTRFRHYRPLCDSCIRRQDT
jgi:hypothetical protein